jgi:integrase
MRNNLKITDKKIAPNHSWRHTFGSVHTNELSPPTEERILKHIMGHSQGGNMTAHYSEVQVRASRMDIERMPCPLDLPDEDEDELFDEMAAQ